MQNYFLSGLWVSRILTESEVQIWIKKNRASVIAKILRNSNENNQNIQNICKKIIFNFEFNQKSDYVYGMHCPTPEFHNPFSPIEFWTFALNDILFSSKIRTTELNFPMVVGF